MTELLRAFGVVGAFVEFAGDGLAGLSLADRATIANMSPEFGATSTLFPIDDETLTYLRLTGRPTELVTLVERYAKAQGLWREPGPGPEFDDLLELDLATVEPSLAGPRRPQDRVVLAGLRDNFRAAFPQTVTPRDGGDTARMDGEGGPANGPGDAIAIEVGGRAATIRSGLGRDRRDHLVHEHLEPDGHGRRRAARPERRGPRAVGRPDRQDVARPGSKAVTGYLEAAGLMDPLERLGFALAGYGCTTCIGNSGPLDEPVATAVEEHDLVVAAVLSGNRNFEGRIHPLARASYLASPPLVVAFALAGRVDIDLTREPLGIGDDGRPVFLADVWPSSDEIRSVIGTSISPDLFRATYATVFDGDDRWRALPIPAGDRFAWDPASTYLARPPFLEGVPAEPAPVTRHRRRPGAGRPRRLGHDRPHLAGRLDRRVVTGRPVAPGPWRRAARVQLVRRPARPARGDDPRDVRATSACATGSSRAGRVRTRSTCPTARRRSSTTRRCATRPRACRSS